MILKAWKKIGPLKILACFHGRSLALQDYRDPYTGQIDTYSLFLAEGFTSIVLALTIDNEVLAIKQFRHGSDSFSLELPAGKSKKNQTPETAAREELAQETGGYEPEKVIPLTTKGIHIEPAYTRHLFYPFLFLGCRKTNLKAKPDKGEYINLVPIPLPKWIEMCYEGEKTDPKSVTTTFLALKYLGYTIQKK